MNYSYHFGCRSELNPLSNFWGPLQVTIHFKTLPVDTKKFAQEIYEFCPDIVDQHFGCFGEIFEAMEESGEEIPEETKKLIEGIDFSSDDYGLNLLEQALKIDGRVELWWD
jgi:hypothetical protein